jgi:lipopolysaccharide transport system permease protein
MSLLALNNLYTHRDLLISWSIRTIRARYQQSILGILWAVIQPAATVLVFAFVFTYFIHVDTRGLPYVVFSFTALVPWTLFTSSITDMVDSLVNNINLVNKIYFPREILPIAALMARVLDFGIAFILLIILIICYRLPFLSINLLYFPLVFVIQIALTIGLGLVGAAMNVFFRDIKHVFVLILQLWLYATPIIYPVSLVPERLRNFYFLNPLSGIIESYREIFLYGNPPDMYLLASALMAIVFLIIGYWFFKRLEYQYADII